MTSGPRRHPRWVLAAFVLASASFAILAHLTIAEGISAPLGAVLSLVPLLLLGSWIIRRGRRREAGYLALVLAAIGVWLFWSSLERHFPAVFFVEHAGGNLLLAYLFGRTLAADEEPLCTRFARLVHGELPPKVGEYTRQVTLAWTIFFVTVAALSCALYLGGFVAAWSIFASVATPVLMVAMFVIEYAIRSRALPNVERVGILGGIRAFSRHFAAPR